MSIEVKNSIKPVDYIKSSQDKMSENVDLNKSYKKLSAMIKIIEK